MNTGLPLEMTYSATDHKNGDRYDGEYELPQRLTVAVQHRTYIPRLLRYFQAA